MTSRHNARWEKLTVRFDRCASKQEAWAALGNMGNEVLRAPLQAVAHRQSQGIDAAEGGYHDWTSCGSLASETLDQAIFTLPVGRLSERLEDSEGFHIVRVIERTEAGRVPFEQAQFDIKETLRKEHIKSQITTYVAKLKQEIPVWNLLEAVPPQDGNAVSAPTILGGSRARNRILLHRACGAWSERRDCGSLTDFDVFGNPKPDGSAPRSARPTSPSACRHRGSTPGGRSASRYRLAKRVQIGACNGRSHEALQLFLVDDRLDFFDQHLAERRQTELRGP